jgi:citrate lyase subunit beta/citryl-CoA lyase
MVPKATLGSVKAALESVPRVVALIESAVGVREADRIASLDGMIALALGGIDLSAELGLEELPNGDEFLFVRSKLALDGAANGVPVIDRVYPHITNEPGLKADTERARALGLRGKLCIHTAQVKTVAAALAPTSVQVSRARRIVETHQRSRSRGVGAEVIEGEMVDAATVRHAQRVLKEGTEAS